MSDTLRWIWGGVGIIVLGLVKMVWNKQAEEMIAVKKEVDKYRDEWREDVKLIHAKIDGLASELRGAVGQGAFRQDQILKLLQDMGAKEYIR